MKGPWLGDVCACQSDGEHCRHSEVRAPTTQHLHSHREALGAPSLVPVVELGK